MERLKQSHDITINWRSYELRPAGGPPITEAYKQRILSYRPRFNAIAQEQYGITVNPGPFGINSRPSQVGEKYAEAQGQGEAYHQNLMDAYWRDARDISDPDVLTDIAVQSGLEAEAYLAALEDEELDELVSADVQQAFQSGISGVPALVFDNKYLVSGAQPYDVLTRVVEEVAAKQTESK